MKKAEVKKEGLFTFEIKAEKKTGTKRRLPRIFVVLIIIISKAEIRETRP